MKLFVLSFVLAIVGSAIAQKCKDMENKALVDPSKYRPDCDDQGKFKPVQCKGNWCFCITPDGVLIQSYAVPEEYADGMKCDCAVKKFLQKTNNVCTYNGNYAPLCLKKLHDHFKMGEKYPQCGSAGNYKAMQHHGHLCQCVEKVHGTELIQVGKYRTHEEDECRRMKCDCAVAEHYAKENGESFTRTCSYLGNFVLGCSLRQLTHNLTRCTTEYLYEAVQCTKDGRCYCADEFDGAQVAHYRFREGTEEYLTSNCQCARDQVIYERLGLKFNARCENNGNYENCSSKVARAKLPFSTIAIPTCSCASYFDKIQCDDTWCYCSNKFGNIIEPYRVPLADKSKMTCDCALQSDRLVRETHADYNDLLCDKRGEYWIH